MRARTLSIVLATSLALIVVLLIPFRYQVCPSWDVLVVDASGNPIPGMTVRLNYQDYSVESKSHEEDRTSDAQGRASFPEQRGFGALVSALSQGVHAGVGRYAYVLAFGQGLQGYNVRSHGYIEDYWIGEPNHMSSKIIAIPNISRP